MPAADAVAIVAESRRGRKSENGHNSGLSRLSSSYPYTGSNLECNNALASKEHLQLFFDVTPTDDGDEDCVGGGIDDQIPPVNSHSNSICDSSSNVHTKTNDCNNANNNVDSVAAGQYIDALLTRSSSTPPTQLPWLALPPTNTPVEEDQNSDPYSNISLGQLLEYNKIPFNSKQKETINKHIILLCDIYKPIILHIFLSQESLITYLGITINNTIKIAIKMNGYYLGFRYIVCSGTIGQCKFIYIYVYMSIFNIIINI